MSEPTGQGFNAAGRIPTPPSPIPHSQFGASAHPGRQAPTLHAQPVEVSILENFALVQDGNKSPEHVQIEFRSSWLSSSAVRPTQADAQDTVHAHSRKRAAGSALLSLPPQPKRLCSNPATAPEAARAWRSDRPDQQEGEQAITSNLPHVFTSSIPWSFTAASIHADLPAPVSVSEARRAEDDEAMRSRLSNLLQHGFAITNSSDANGYVLALSNPHRVSAKALVHISTDLLAQTRDPAELTELIFAQAIARARLDVAEAIASQGWRPSAAQARDAELVERAVHEDRFHLLRALMEAGADTARLDGNGNSLLHLAVQADVSEVVELLAVPEMINLVNRSGNTALHLAIKRDRSLDRCVALLSKGADTEIRDGNGDTPLICAIRLGKAKEMTALLRAGANPNARDRAGNTPLHLACTAGNETAMQLLLAKSCDTRPVDALGRTALDIVEQKIDEQQGFAQEAEDEDVLDQGNYDLLRYHTPTQEEERALAAAGGGRNTH